MTGSTLFAHICHNYVNLSIILFNVLSDIDECALGTDTCGFDEVCLNDPGAFRCIQSTGGTSFTIFIKLMLQYSINITAITFKRH